MDDNDKMLIGARQFLEYNPKQWDKIKNIYDELSVHYRKLIENKLHGQGYPLWGICRDRRPVRNG